MEGGIARRFVSIAAQAWGGGWRGGGGGGGGGGVGMGAGGVHECVAVFGIEAGPTDDVFVAGGAVCHGEAPFAVLVWW